VRDDTLREEEADGLNWPRGVVRAAAPWLVRGDAYVVFTSSPAEVNIADAGIPHELWGVYNGLFNVMLMANCRESPVGPYRELLYVPGRFRFSFDEERMSVTRSYVSTQASLLNRRANWNVPSDLAEIRNHSRDEHHDEFHITRPGAGGPNAFAHFSFEMFGPELPVNGRVIPEAFRMFGQLRKDVTLLHSLAVTGTMRSARFTPHAFDPHAFPDMKRRQVVAAIKISDFLLDLPAATTMAWTLA
jgi:hypothetical protein